LSAACSNVSPQTILVGVLPKKVQVFTISFCLAIFNSPRIFLPAASKYGLYLARCENLHLYIHFIISESVNNVPRK